MEEVANAGPWQNLDQQLLDALQSFGYAQMTPVQQATLPLFLGYKDVVVEAVTGSGKTLAYVIPVLELVLRRYREGRPLKKNEIGVLIIAPTRELASQIHQVMTPFIDYYNSNENSLSLRHSLFIGGHEPRQDIEDFVKNGSQIVIGTPGRLDDLLKRSSIFSTKEVEVLVMDEADRLLDMGFEQQLMAIIQRIPKQRRTGLFSATMTEALSKLVKTGLRNPVRVSVKVQTTTGTLMTEQKIPSTLKIFYLLCDSDQKISQLLHIIKGHEDEKFIVYFSTGACVDYFFKVLSLTPASKALNFHSLHGKMDPKRREAVYTKFAASTGSSILLCTDVAARGLDIPDIDWVIQFDPPQDPKAFAHRCGRTARIGKDGKAVVFLTPSEDTYVEFLGIRKLPLSAMEPATIEDLGTTLDPKNITAALRRYSKKDRDVYEKSIKAFVSWVRSYKEHQASYIFQISKTDLGSVARSMGILRLPKMPELKTMNLDFEEEDIQTENIAYKDKVREKSRKAKLERAANEPQATKKVYQKKEISWSQTKDQKEKKVERKEKKERKRIAILVNNEAKRSADTACALEQSNDYQEYRDEKRLKKQ